MAPSLTCCHSPGPKLRQCFRPGAGASMAWGASATSPYYAVRLSSMAVSTGTRQLRRWVGLLSVITLALIALDAAGFELSVPSLGGSPSQSTRALNGVKAVAASTLVRVGTGAPAGGEL